MITLYLNCAKVWVRLVQFTCRITRRPQVTYEAPPMPARARLHSATGGNADSSTGGSR